MYVCLSVRFRGKRDFLGPYLRYRSNFLCADSPQEWASILQIFCPLVCWSVYKRQKSFATYGICHPCFLYKNIFCSFLRLPQLKKGYLEPSRDSIPSGLGPPLGLKYSVVKLWVCMNISYTKIHVVWNFQLSNILSVRYYKL